MTGSDDMLVRVFNYNTLEKVHSFEAHTDYIRSIVVHPTHPYLLSSSGNTRRMYTQPRSAKWLAPSIPPLVLLSPSSLPPLPLLPDDMTVKLWDWEKKWQCSQVFEGHSHYVMMVVINPKDHNQFASASLDRTIKVRWGGGGDG